MPQAQSGGSLVTSGNIVDGTIINEDINANAAIAWSKLNTAGQVGSAALQAAIMKTATIEVSSAEILDIHNTPKTLVAAPGAGKVNVPLGAVVFFDYGTVQYAAGSELRITYGGVNDALVPNIQASQFNPAADTIRYHPSGKASNDLYVVLTSGIDAAIELEAAGAAQTNGDGTLKIFLRYFEITL